MQAFEVFSALGGVESAVVEGSAVEAKPMQEVEGVEIEVSFNRLFRSVDNVRKKRNAQSIPELAASIRAESLLQRLSVVPEMKKGKPTGRYGVVAGGRRLEALALLVNGKVIPNDHPIPCKEFPPERAVGVSLTENLQQEPMHAADMVEAFKVLVDSGISIPEIAGRYGLSELTVERRLTLANLAPQFLQMYRDGKIEPKQLQALALTPDHAKQIAVWDSLPSWNRSAHCITSALTEDEMPMNAPLAVFVGVAAYEAAGGVVRRDLFGEADDGFLQDPQLVQKLATEKLDREAEAVRERGWKWVEVREEFDYREQARFTRIYPKTVKPTAEESAAIEEMDETIRALREAINALEAPAISDDRELSDEESARREELEEQISNIGELRREMMEAQNQWGPVQLKTAGAVLTINRDGRLNVIEGLVRAEDRKVEKPGKNGSSAAFPEKVKPAFSERLMSSLTAHRTAAVSAALLDNPHVAKVALLHRLIVSQNHGYMESPVRVTLTDSGSRVRELATAFAETPAAAALDAAQERWGSKLPDDSAALFRHLLIQDAGTLDELIALHVARSFDAIRGREPQSRGFDLTDALVEALDVDMADWWAPTPAHYLENVPKAKMIEAVTEACGEPEARDLAKMKRVEAIAGAAAKLEGKRWLPAPLRRAAVVESDSDADAGSESDED